MCLGWNEAHLDVVVRESHVDLKLLLISENRLLFVFLLQDHALRVAKEHEIMDQLFFLNGCLLNQVGECKLSVFVEKHNNNCLVAVHSEDVGL
jgi:hypothetical protein